MPTQGLPTLPDAVVRMLTVIPPPAPLITEWLHTLPPQHVPPGCPTRVHAHDLIRGWGRRLIATALNATLAVDLDCWRHGTSSKRRPKMLVLGDKVFGSQAHADGIGHFNYSIIFWELDPNDPNYYVITDFNESYPEHKNITAIKRLFSNDGAIELTDQELMSMLFDGVRYKTTPPRQIRIAHQLQSLSTRIRKVSASYSKLLAAGLHQVHKLVDLSAPNPTIDPDGPGMIAQRDQRICGLACSVVPVRVVGRAAGA